MKIFDIGANIGYYVLMQSKLIGKKGKILAVEPVRKNMKLLKKNLELNKNNITRTIQVAVTNKKKFKKFNGSEIFYTTSHSNIGRLDNLIHEIVGLLAYRITGRTKIFFPDLNLIVRFI